MVRGVTVTHLGEGRTVGLHERPEPVGDLIPEKYFFLNFTRNPLKLKLIPLGRVGGGAGHGLDLLVLQGVVVGLGGLHLRWRGVDRCGVWGCLVCGDLEQWPPCRRPRVCRRRA